MALVDDVMTTGATLNAISQLLLEGGARSVSAWVVARTPAPPSATRATTRAEQAQHERPEREQA
jgi:adenine/guanine phosphoribosyltransferase-like PRPP-binding protein